MQKKSFVIKCVILLGLTSCARVAIKDAEWCADQGDFGAQCFNTISDKERYIEKEAWDEIRFGMLCTSSDSFANWKAAIKKLCSVNKNLCTYEEVETLEKLDQKFSKVEKETNYLKEVLAHY